MPPLFRLGTIITTARQEEGTSGLPATVSLPGDLTRSCPHDGLKALILF